MFHPLVGLHALQDSYAPNYHRVIYMFRGNVSEFCIRFSFLSRLNDPGL